MSGESTPRLLQKFRTIREVSGFQCASPFDKRASTTLSFIVNFHGFAALDPRSLERCAPIRRMHTWTPPHVALRYQVQVV
ncbi:hypothetical protein PHLCEN_2v6662 [Hermanssonia centrifuga]|uniref:Uncharacterized protein n=1 Tax=Hermanssonia centrifuga TaxID=98765 RepID=A0A2R6NYX1_9APHY|nr:hypothetical protein PHLCEN_2v6662 [Hermanssonia centrifuga]